MKTLAILRDEVESWRKHDVHLHDLIDLANLNDPSLRGELETEIAKLKQPNIQTEQQPWWKKIVGTFENDTMFDEAVRLQSLG